MTSPSRRVCVVYDGLFPYTLGGADRWYRNLAEMLAKDGFQVTFLTLRQWPRDHQPDVPGVDVVAVGPQMKSYGRNGARRISQPLVFGAGVFWHLLRRGRDYDVVHTASFPYFSLIAIGLLRPLHRYLVVVDWHEFWSQAYWRRYLGGLKGWVGWFVQAICVRIRQRAFCFARMTAERLRANGLNGEVTVLEGEYAGPAEGRPPRPAEPLVVFAGRHIPEKRALLVAPAVLLARQSVAGLRAKIFGIGPQTEAIREQIREAGAEDIVEVCGVVSDAEVEENLGKALCMMLPSMREGYGMIVIEAAAQGAPTILGAGEDNAATEHIQDGVNGFVVDQPTAEDLASAVIRTHEAGFALRQSTSAWFADNAKRLSMSSSLEAVVAAYTRGDAR